MKASARFWDRMSARYARTPVADEAAYQEKLRRTRDLLTPESVVFEFGCGTGSTSVSHGPFAAQIRAIDVSQNMIDIACEKARSANVQNVDFQVGTIEGFDASPGSFDMVMAHSILHLVHDKDAAIRKSFELLKPGGWFVSSTICMGDRLIMRVIARAVSAVSLLGLLPYINRTSRAQLVDAIAAAGFAIEQQWQPKPLAALFVIARKPQ